MNDDERVPIGGFLAMIMSSVIISGGAGLRALPSLGQRDAFTVAGLVMFVGYVLAATLLPDGGSDE